MLEDTATNWCCSHEASPARRQKPHLAELNSGEKFLQQQHQQPQQTITKANRSKYTTASATPTTTTTTPATPETMCPIVHQTRPSNGTTTTATATTTTTTTTMHRPPPDIGPPQCRCQTGASGPFGRPPTRLAITSLLLVLLVSLLSWPVGASAGDAGGSKSSSSSLTSGTSRRRFDLSKSKDQLGDWLVHQVAPAVATKLLDNVLATSSSSSSSSSSGSRQAKSSSSDQQQQSAINTQLLADKIVDKLADNIKRRKQQQQQQQTATSERSMDGSNKSTSKAAEVDTRPSAATKKAGPGSSRRGKSLVSDSVQQVMQNLFAKTDQLPLRPSFFGRAMEKQAKMQHNHRQQQQQHNQHQQQQQSSWLMLKEPNYEPPPSSSSSSVFASTDSSQLDENPVVLRAEHGHNSTTSSPPTIVQPSYTPTRQQQQQQILNKQRLQQKYVHTNRHQPAHNQQQLLRPNQGWQQQQQQQQQHSRRHQSQQSPYSLPVVTSDMNIVQAPSSPSPVTTMPTTTTSTTSTTTTMPTTTSTTTTTQASVPFVPLSSSSSNNHIQVHLLGPNKFKINNRHQQPLSSVAISPNSWYSTNSNHRNHHHHHHQRYPMPTQPASTSTTTTTTTTTSTTTTTTPEPPPPTEMMPNEMMLQDLDQQTSAPLVSSILSSVAQSALDTLGSSSNGQQMDDNYNSMPYQQQQNSSLSSGTSSPPSQGATKTAPSSTTTARHSVITAEAIPTALGAPLYHLTRANYTATSFMGPPPRRSGGSSPVAKAMAQYLQKGMTSLSSTIFGRQSKTWARRLGLSSVLLSGLLYSAAVLSNPGAPLPTNGFEVLQAISKGTKKRRGGLSNMPTGPLSAENLLTAATQAPGQSLSDNIDRITSSNAVLLDNNVNLLYQQHPHLMSIVERLVQQEQQQRQQQQQLQLEQNSIFSQRSLTASPIEITNNQDVDVETNVDKNAVNQEASSNNLLPSQRRSNPSQAIYTLRALPNEALFSYETAGNTDSFRPNGNGFNYHLTRSTIFPSTSVTVSN